MERDAGTDELEQFKVKLPRPVPGGSYPVQSLGRWIDRLMGDTRARRKAAAMLEPLLMTVDEMPPDPEPIQVPPPVR